MQQVKINGIWGHERASIAMFLPDPSDGAEAAEVWNGRGLGLSPENLMRRAVLVDALKCLTRGGRSAQAALEWMGAGEGEAWWPCSFWAICETFGLSPRAVLKVARAGGGGMRLGRQLKAG